MYKFIVRLALFALPVLVFIIVMEIFLRSIPNEYKFKKNLIDSNASAVEVLVLGNSHAQNGISPADMQYKAINMAYSSQIPIYDNYILERYIDEMSNLKVVIMVISYFSFGYEMHKAESWRPYFYYHYYGCDYFVSNWSLKKYSFILLFTFKKSIKHITDFMRHRPMVRFDKYGWIANNLDTEDLVSSGLKYAILHNQYSSDEFYVESSKAIERIIELCKKHNIQLILLRTPKCSTYLNHVDVQKETHMLNIIDSIAKEYNLKFYDFSRDSNYRESDFNDAQHLSTAGARKFTEVLNSLIK